MLFSVAVLVLGRWRGSPLGRWSPVRADAAGRSPGDPDGRGPWRRRRRLRRDHVRVADLTHGSSARTSRPAPHAGVARADRRSRSGFTAAAGSPGSTTRRRRSSPRWLGRRRSRLLLAAWSSGRWGFDDVTVTRPARVGVRRANQQLGARALFRSAMRIGRDHVASAVNTLGARLRRGVPAAAAALQPVRAESRRGGDQPGRRHRDRPDPGRQHRPRGVRAGHDGGRGPRGEPGTGGARPGPDTRPQHATAVPRSHLSGRNRRTGPGEQRRLAVALAVEQHLEPAERCAHPRPAPGTVPVPPRPRTIRSPRADRPGRAPRRGPGSGRGRGTAGTPRRRTGRRSRWAARGRGRGRSSGSARPLRAQRPAGPRPWSPAGEMSTASTASPRRASQTATPPRPHATSRARPVTGKQAVSSAAPARTAGGAGRRRPRGGVAGIPALPVGGTAQRRTHSV